MTLAKTGHVSVDGARLGYRVEGEGRVVLIPGSHLLSPRTFSSRFRSTHSCVFADHRAFVPGANAPSGRPFGLAEAVEDVEAVRRHLSVDRVVVVGHSMFGHLALAYAVAYPDVVDGVVLIGSGPRASGIEAAVEAHWESEASDDRKRAWKVDRERVARELEIGEWSSRDRLVHEMLSADRARRSFDLDRDETPLWAGIDLEMAMFGSYLEHGAGAYDLTSEPKIDSPVLVATGRFDFVVPPVLWDGAASERLLRATFVTFEFSGHTPQSEEPDAFDASFEAWLNTVGLGDR